MRGSAAKIDVGDAFVANTVATRWPAQSAGTLLTLMISTEGPVTENRMETSAPTPRSTNGMLVMVGTSRTVVLVRRFFVALIG
jgi:hypothetical protein